MSDDTTPPTPPKPGYRTTEFYLSLLATLLTYLFASGALTSSTSLAIAGMAATVLTALGYKVSRTIVKVAGAMVLVLAIGSMSCAKQHPGEVAKHALIDCAKQDAPAVLAALVSLASLAIGPGPVDWGKEEIVAEQHGIVVGGCALAELVAGLWPSAASSPGTATSALLADDPSRTKAMVSLEVIRGKAGGARFVTSTGEM